MSAVGTGLPPVTIVERTTTRIETPNGTAVLRGPRDGHGRPPHPPPRPIYIPIVTSRHSQEERDGLGTCGGVCLHCNIYGISKWRLLSLRPSPNNDQERVWVHRVPWGSPVKRRRRRRIIESWCERGGKEEGGEDHKRNFARLLSLLQRTASSRRPRPVSEAVGSTVNTYCERKRRDSRSNFAQNPDVNSDICMHGVIKHEVKLTLSKKGRERSFAVICGVFVWQFDMDYGRTER